MISRASSDFWAAYDRLPAAVQRHARKQYQRFRQDPHHPSLHFKELSTGLVSVRVTLSYRALGYREGETILWFWIGTHAEYDRLIS